MAGLKSLAKETAIYGLSSIVGRFLNYLLVPVYTMAMSAQSGGYGVVTNVYAWVALMLVLLTCGMETGFFRFANKGEDDPMRVYSTTLLSVSMGALTFLALGLLFLDPIAGWMEYSEHPWYVGMMMIVVAMDAIQSIPFAYLRYKKRPIKFAALKLLFIFLNIALNLVYYVGMKGDDVGYAFLFNLICTSTIMLCMIPELRGFAYDCIAGPADMVEDGKNGYLIPLFDEEMFKKKLVYLMQHDEVRNQMVQNAPPSVLKYSTSVVCEKYLDFILNNK